jgi:hypothetical protein
VTRAALLLLTGWPHLTAHPSPFCLLRVCLLRAMQKDLAIHCRAVPVTGLSGGADLRAVPVPGVRRGWSVQMSRRLLVLFCRAICRPWISLPVDIPVSPICIAETPRIDNSDLDDSEGFDAIWNNQERSGALQLLSGLLSAPYAHGHNGQPLRIYCGNILCCARLADVRTEKCHNQRLVQTQ